MREITLLALLSSLVVVAKWAVRLPIKIPGHSGLLWIAVFIIGRGLLRRRGAAVLLGLLAGVLTTIFVPADQGLFVWVKYLAAGIALEACTMLMGDRLDRVVPAMLSGAAAHVAKLVSSLIVSWALGMPIGYLALGLGMSATTHIAFGALGGLLGALTLKGLRRTGAHFLRAWMDEGDRP